MEFTIKKADKAYAEQIEKIENECFSYPWSAKDITESMDSFTVFFVAETATDVCGYCGMQICDGGFITNVAVKKAYRKNGIAQRLLQEILQFANRKKLDFVTLEVRESNIPAISLYKKCGFAPVGKRPAFYTSPREDALLMTVNLQQ